MNLRPWLRLAGLAAVWGGVLGIANALLAAAAYYNHDWSRAAAPAWATALVSGLPVAFEFDTPARVYQTYGRLLLPVFILLLVGAIGMQIFCLLRGRIQPDVGFRLLAAGLVLGLVGNLADYWLGAQSLGQIASVIRSVIGAELGALVYLAGAIVMAVRLFRRGPLPRWQAVLLGLAPVLGVLLSFTGVRHIPAGFVLPVSLSWLVIGLHLWIDQTRPTLPLDDLPHLRATSK